MTVVFECETLGGMQCLLSMAVSEFVEVYRSVSDFNTYVRNGNVGIYSLFYTNMKYFFVCLLNVRFLTLYVATDCLIQVTVH